MGAENNAKMATKTRNNRAPSEKPPFTVSQLKKVIPPHCFERSTIRSSSYLVADLVIILVLFYASTFLNEAYLHPLTLYVAWPIYWFLQGSVATGVWVIAHECGHQAFSDSGFINDSLGFVLHSALMVPYFSWKYSHRRHHSNTGSLEYDEGQNFRVVLQAFILDLQYFWEKVALSDAGLLSVLFILYRIGSATGFLWLAKTYLMPLVVVNAFLVLITFLQHTHTELPHYDDSEWDWLRGALATVDRDYGLLNYVFHHIGDTHVAHHIFSTMPHYHAQEATEAIKPILKDYYKKDTTPISSALWREYRECVYVSEDPTKRGVYWYEKLGKK